MPNRKRPKRTPPQKDGQADGDWYLRHLADVTEAQIFYPDWPEPCPACKAEGKFRFQVTHGENQGRIGELLCGRCGGKGVEE